MAALGEHALRGSHLAKALGATAKGFLTSVASSAPEGRSECTVSQANVRKFSLTVKILVDFCIAAVF